MGDNLRYFARPNTWFKSGTEAIRCEEMYEGHAIYSGTYIVGSCSMDESDHFPKPYITAGYDKFWYGQGYKNGDEVQMREICSDDEFIVKFESNGKWIRKRK